MSPPSVETASTPVAADRSLFPASQSRVECLRDRFHQIRNFTNALCAGLEPEDCVVQSMPDVSPTKWHLAHTTWFFETFILKKFVPGYRAEIPEYAYLFNSYYNAAGDMHRRDLRGLISRPTVSQAQRLSGIGRFTHRRSARKSRRKSARRNRADSRPRHPSRTATSGIAHHGHQARFGTKPALPCFSCCRRTDGNGAPSLPLY